METRIAKKSRFRIDKLEERVAPSSATASAGSWANVSGQAVMSQTLPMSLSQQFGGVSSAVAGSVSASVGVNIPSPGLL